MPCLVRASSSSQSASRDRAFIQWAPIAGLSVSTNDRAPIRRAPADHQSQDLGLALSQRASSRTGLSHSVPDRVFMQRAPAGFYRYLLMVRARTATGMSLFRRRAGS